MREGIKGVLHMNKYVKILAQFLFVIILDVLVVGWIHIESEKWEGIKAAAAAEAAIPEVQIDARSGFEIDPQTKFIMGNGFPAIRRECVKCHPTQMVRSFRADRAGWLDAIRWMQAEKGLKNFSEKTEDTILTYLETYYGK